MVRIVTISPARPLYLLKGLDIISCQMLTSTLVSYACSRPNTLTDTARHSGIMVVTFSPKYWSWTQSTQPWRFDDEGALA